jgi:GPH family glycoside/pentoside/hexuronide:cation symporter
VSQAQPLTLRIKGFYGVGAISMGVHVYVLSLLLFFYNQIIGLPAQMVSLALAATLVLDAIWDPLVGQFSDRLRTPWGRRHPLMYFAVIPVAVTMYLLWRPPAGTTVVEKTLWLFAFALAGRTMIGVFEVANQALAPELAPDYHQRTNLMAWRWVFFTFGGAFVTLLGSFVFFHATKEYPKGQFNPAGWGPFTLTATVMMAVPILVSALGTHDRVKTLHRPPDRHLTLGQTVRDIARTLNNWNLGVALSASTAGGISVAIYLGLALYIDSFVWGLNAKEVGLMQIAALVALLPGAWLAGAISRRFGKKRACIASFLLATVVLQGPILAKVLGAFPSHDTPAYLPLLAFLRFAWSVLNNAGYIVVTSMVADIVEDAQVKSGNRAEGLLMATNAFVVKLTAGVSALLPGLILAYVHFPAKAAGAVDPAVVSRLIWVYLPSMTSVSVISILVWTFYRIDQATHERNLATLREAEAQAQAATEALGEAAPVIAAAE